eukprot:TRINITY_DN7049_c0_g1_i1.p1 TRINITY_DN7049_c0_g1~~TRINITY_DN7049_c0_g1_i1.p1  ORF type:complete len:687 (+),score=112.93 TRINITY_DN7049_c0_g1_i1:1-2061(+)
MRLLIFTVLFVCVNSLSVPVNIRVVFAGFAGNSHLIEYSLFLKQLRSSMEVRTPSSFQSQKHVNVSFHILYEIVSDEDLLTAYENVLHRSYQRSSGNIEYGRIILDTEEFISSGLFKISDNNDKRFQYTIYIVNPDTSKLRPYTFRSCASSNADQESFVASNKFWIGPGRYVVLDMGAEGSQFGLGNPHEGNSPATFAKFPSLNVNQKNLKSNGIIDGHLISFITETINHVLIPDMRWDLLLQDDRVLIPIIVLKNHNQFSVLDHNSPGFIDKEMINDRVSKLLSIPGQQFMVLVKEEFLHVHNQISMSVYKSLRSDTYHQVDSNGVYKPIIRQFLDSRRFIHELSEIPNDPFARELLEQNPKLSEVLVSSDASSDDNPSLLKKSQSGTRILPIYVLSLVGMNPQLTLEDLSLVQETQQAIVVLQTNVSNIQTPFFFETDSIKLNGYNPNRNIIAGIVSALGGVVEPSQSLHPVTKEINVEHAWSTGYSPFSPFSSCTSVSKIFNDAIVRNHIISRFDYTLTIFNKTKESISNLVKKYVYAPFGKDVLESTMDDDTNEVVSWIKGLYQEVKIPRIRKELSKLISTVSDSERMVEHILELLKSGQVEEAYELSSSFYETAKHLDDQVKEELELIENTLACCHLQHLLESPVSWSRYITIFVSSFILFGFVFFAITRNPNSRSKKKTR